MAKWRHPEELTSAARSLRLPSAAVASARFVPIVEAVLAVGLLVSPWPVFPVASVASLGLMLAYTAVIARGLTMTPRPSCGCFGRIGHPINASSLVRNVVLSIVAVIAVAWGVAGSSVPAALWLGGWPMVGWLLALAVTAAVVWWIASEANAAPATTATPTPVTDASSEMNRQVADGDGDVEDYEREPIPPIMLVQDDKPVTLRSLAEKRAQLLVWITCGCGRLYEAVELVARWSAEMPAIDVRLVSTQTEELSRGLFPSVDSWLLDPGAGAMMALGMRSDPSAVLLGADGLLAGGPVEGLSDITEFGKLIAEQLSEVDDLPGPQPQAPSQTASMDASTVRLSQGETVASLSELAAGERLMLLMVSEFCPSCEDIRVHADEHAATLASRRVRVAVAYPFHPRQALPHDEAITWVDEDATLPAAFGVNASPAALLFDGDGALLKGPAVGSNHVAMFLAEAVE